MKRIINSWLNFYWWHRINLFYSVFFLSNKVCFCEYLYIYLSHE